MKPHNSAGRSPVPLSLLAATLALAWSALGPQILSAQQEDSPGERVDELFENVDRAGTPGASVAVYRDGEILYSRGYGRAQLEYDIPITPETVFHVASVSKQFTAFALVLLAERGELSLDDDIREHLPEVPDFGRTITIRHLIHHTSGLRDQWTLLAMAGWRLDDVITLADILRLVRMQGELNFEPGAEHVYSNTGYTLLAEIVARVTGEPFREWMDENVFEPLEMTNTHFHDDHQMIVPNRAYSYTGSGDGQKKLVLSYANVGATSLFTTAEDLTKWAENFYEPSVGSPDAIRQMEERGVLTNGDTIPYAFGLAIGEHRGLRTVSHSGGDAGFRSYLLMVPEMRFAVAVLSNGASVNPSMLAGQTAELFLEDELSDELSDESSRETVTEEEIVQVSEDDLERVTGRYWQPEQKYMRTIRRHGTKMFYDRGGSASELGPLGNDRFLMLEVDAHLIVSFEPAGAKPERMVVVVDGASPVVSRVVEGEPTRDILAAYVGDYHSPELDATYQVRLDDDQLVLHHWRHGDFPLETLTDDMFTSSAWWLGSVEFERDESGAVRGFRASSDRVRNLAFHRVD